MSLKKTTRRILKSAANVRSYPSTGRGSLMFRGHPLGSQAGKARKPMARLLKRATKQARRKLYLGRPAEFLKTK